MYKHSTHRRLHNQCRSCEVTEDWWTGGGEGKGGRGGEEKGRGRRGGEGGEGKGGEGREGGEGKGGREGGGGGEGGGEGGRGRGRSCLVDGNEGRAVNCVHDPLTRLLAFFFTPFSVSPR